MSTYAIGDIQGCYTELQRLLELIQFDPHQDVLWCTGDLVNRGTQSLEVLRFFKDLKQQAIVVLGNHDLHLLAVAHNIKNLKPQDTLLPILNAPDAHELLTWLRYRPLLHHDSQLGFTMIHAGLPPQWDLSHARQYALELEQILQGSTYTHYLDNLYGNKPKIWSDQLTGWERLRFISNCLTRLRYCTAQGSLALKNKQAPFLPENKNDDIQPWFKYYPYDINIVFGHWASLGYYTEQGIYAIDTGCVWGGALTALRLEDKKVFTLPCAGYANPHAL